MPIERPQDDGPYSRHIAKTTRRHDDDDGASSTQADDAPSRRACIVMTCRRPVGALSGRAVILPIRRQDASIVLQAHR